MLDQLVQKCKNLEELTVQFTCDANDSARGAIINMVTQIISQASHSLVQIRLRYISRVPEEL